tara:strand:- start:89 stop:238 length:150 start_codon:yes stop_codon:yes gene_type:complete
MNIKMLLEEYMEDTFNKHINKISEMDKDQREEKLSSLLDFALSNCPFDF